MKKRLLKNLISFALFIAMVFPMSAAYVFAETEITDTIPEPPQEYCNEIRVMFMNEWRDDFSGLITNGRYTDHKAGFEYTTEETELLETENGYQEISNGLTTTVTPYTEEDYCISQWYTLTSSLSVTTNEDGTWSTTKTWPAHIEEGITLSETVTPDTYKPLGGNITIKANKELTEMEVINDGDVRCSWVQVNNGFVIFVYYELLDEYKVPEPPEEFERYFYLKFVDTDGNPLKSWSGVFTDNLTCEKYSEYITYTKLNDNRKWGLIESNNTYGEGELPIETYDINDEYLFRSSLVVGFSDNGSWHSVLEYPSHIEEGITLSEVERPLGYKSLEGSVTIKGSKDLSNLEIVRDDTGRAYIDGDTIYIVYEKNKNFCSWGEEHIWCPLIKPADFKEDGYRYEYCEKCVEHRNYKTIPKIKTVELSKNSYTYNGYAKKPKITVKDKLGNVISKSNYTVTYKKNTKAGTATAVIEMKGKKYTGKKTVHFTIAPKKAEPEVVLSKTSYKYNGKVRKPKITVKVGKKTLKNKRDYTIRYLTDCKKAGKHKIRITLKGNYKGAKTVSYNIS